MARKQQKPTLIPVDDLSDSDDQLEVPVGKDQVVSDSEESYDEFAEDELYENVFDGPITGDEPSVSDVEISSSDEDIHTMKKKVERKQLKQKESDSDEETKDQKDVSKLVKTTPDVIKTRKAKSGEIEIDFELVQPSEAYYHQVKAML
jgi:hypothetical protein